MPISDVVLSLLLASTAPVGAHQQPASLGAEAITQPNGGAMVLAATGEHFPKGKLVSSAGVKHPGLSFERTHHRHHHGHKGGRIIEHKGGAASDRRVPGVGKY